MIVQFMSDGRRRTMVRAHNRALGDVLPVPFPSDTASPIGREIAIGVAIYVVTRLIDRLFFGGKA